MKTIKYNNKTIKLPFKDADYSDEPLELETVTNPFSGQSIAMPKFAVAVYDVTTGSNLIAERYDEIHGMGTSPDRVPVFKALCANDGIVDGSSVSRHRSLFTAEAIRYLNFFFRVDLTIKWDGNFFTIPVNCFLFWFFKLFHIFLLSKLILHGPGFVVKLGAWSLRLGASTTG